MTASLSCSLVVVTSVLLMSAADAVDVAGDNGVYRYRSWRGIQCEEMGMGLEEAAEECYQGMFVPMVEGNGGALKCEFYESMSDCYQPYIDCLAVDEDDYAVGDHNQAVAAPIQYCLKKFGRDCVSCIRVEDVDYRTYG